LRTQLLDRLPAWNLGPAVELRGPDQRPPWGVEWRSAELDKVRIVNLCNYRHAPATVSLYRNGQPASARDVLTGAAMGNSLTLSPLECRLVRVDQVAGARQ
jgi:hypothetical protein